MDDAFWDEVIKEHGTKDYEEYINQGWKTVDMVCKDLNKKFSRTYAILKELVDAGKMDKERCIRGGRTILVFRPKIQKD